MADEELSSGPGPEASNVVRLPRDWLGPREALVPLGLLPDPGFRVSDLDADSGPRRSRGVTAPPFEPPAPMVSADAFWGEEAQSLHQVVELPRRGQPSDSSEQASAQTIAPQPADPGLAQATAVLSVAETQLDEERMHSTAPHYTPRRSRLGVALIGIMTLAVLGLVAAVLTLGLHRAAPASSGVAARHGAVTTAIAGDSHSGSHRLRGGQNAGTHVPAGAQRTPSRHDHRSSPSRHGHGSTSRSQGSTNRGHGSTSRSSTSRNTATLRSRVTHSAPVDPAPPAEQASTASTPIVQTPLASSIAADQPTGVTESESAQTPHAQTPQSDAGEASSTPSTPESTAPSTTAHSQVTKDGADTQLPSGALPSPQQAALAP
jgi:hypothetical protein